MGTVTAAVLAWRARRRLWRARFAARRAALPQGLVTSVALMVAGGVGAIAGGWLISRWCMGLVIIVESAGLVVLGVARDDGQPLPVRGAHTVEQALELERDWDRSRGG